MTSTMQDACCYLVVVDVRGPYVYTAGADGIPFTQATGQAFADLRNDGYAPAVRIIQAPNHFALALTGPGADTRPQIEVGYWTPTRYSVKLPAADVAATLREHGSSPSAVLAAVTADRIAAGDITAGEARGDEDESKLGTLIYAIAGHFELFGLPGWPDEPDNTDTPEDFSLTVIPAAAVTP